MFVSAIATIVIATIVVATDIGVIAKRMRNRFKNAVDLYRGVIVRLQTLSAVIADFERIEITKFAFAATDAVAVVKHAFAVPDFISFHITHLPSSAFVKRLPADKNRKKLSKKYEQTFAFYLSA